MANHDSWPSTHRCALYTPGHNIHFIQARLAWTNPQDDVRGELLGIEAGVINVGLDDGTIRRFRNHDLERFAAIAAALGSSVVLRRHGVLVLPHESGGNYFCVKPDDGDPLDPCIDPADVPAAPVTASHEDVARHLLSSATHLGGGYVTLPGPQDN